MKVFKWILYILLVPVVLFGLFLAYSSITDYSPEETVVLAENNSVENLSDTLSYSFVCWNIGYAGLDESMDFFYDGGEMVRPSKQGSMNNLSGILQTLKEYQNTDFVLLEEVDINSKRSYHINQLETINQHFPDYHKVMGINYDVDFVPLPPSQPMGKVKSGLAIFSKAIPAKSTRYNFPGNYKWPMSIFMLDRCFVVNEYPLSNGKKLIVLITHNSAYDDGTLRKQQMDFMKDVLINFYNEGNYVVAGGDWNQCPYNFKPEFEGDVFDTDNLIYIDEHYPDADWTWAYDPGIPTNRRVIAPYTKGKTPTTVIDYFLCSPNVVVEKVNGKVLNFKYSDHQPVELKIKLLP